MNRVLSIAAVALICGGWSCGFPTVIFTDASTEDATMLDAPAPEAGDDGGSETGAEAGVNCDKDNDKYEDMFTCDGSDCNDNDPNVHPGINGWIFTVPDSGNLCGMMGTCSLGFPNGDWNCDGVVEIEYPLTLATSGCGSNCTAQGFQQITNCGQSDWFGSCGGVFPVCTYNDGGIQFQGCK